MQGAKFTAALVTRVIGEMKPDEPDFSFTGLTAVLACVTLVLFAPLYLFVMYSLGTVYPVLAMVENPNPPAYEAVTIDENDATPAPAPTADSEDSTGVDVASPSTKPIAGSIRGTFRLLWASSGLKGNFRGLILGAVYVVVYTTVQSIFGGIAFMAPFASLLTMLALAPISAGWVHAIIRKESSPTRFWRNLPPYRRTLEATCMPILLVWVGSMLTEYIPGLLRQAMHLKEWDPSHPSEIPNATPSAAWKLMVVIVVQLVFSLVLVIPSVLMTRIQASLLAPDANTIVPFDRSFDGTVEPTVVGGRGYVTIRDAFRTFSGPSWVRLLILYAKFYAVSILLNLVVFAILLTEVLLTSKGKETVN